MQSVATIVATHISRLTGRKSQKEIARSAGFANPNYLSMLKSGETKLALDKVIPLADALECNAHELMRSALREAHGQDVAEALEQLLCEYTAGERAIIDKLRELLNVRAIRARRSVDVIIGILSLIGRLGRA